MPLPSLRQLAACALLALAVLIPATATASEQAIRDTLERWTDDFNAARAERVCALFAPELRYDYRGFPERGYREICDLLQRSLSDPQRRFTYALDIKEILISGDLAAVRLIWTLRITTGDPPDSTRAQEYGIDLFRRQTDGSWKIVRYLAYEAP
jgi:steroid delta-isomerase